MVTLLVILENSDPYDMQWQEHPSSDSRIDRKGGQISVATIEVDNYYIYLRGYYYVLI